MIDYNEDNDNFFTYNRITEIDDNYSQQYENNYSRVEKKIRKKFRKKNTILEDWALHIDQDGLEYVTGYIREKNKDWETSTIKEKIVLSEALLIITENESIYILPYSEKNI